MNKDVIYVDVEDDITAIIDKLKSAKARVVAIVPPKRIGVLQSAVNLRLLARAAETSDKRLVLISNSPQLQALAATSKIPVAKNLQTKPEIPVIPEFDSADNEELIDGAALPVGELARTTDTSAAGSSEATKPASRASAVDNIASDGATKNTEAPAKATAKSKKTKSKVPDFSRFRKKLLIFGSLGVLLIGFLVWAIWFAPQATIVVSARTTEVPISMRANLSSGQATDFEAQTLRVNVQEVSHETSVDFEATGEEERGEKATGVMTLSRGAGGSVHVPAGTSFTSDGYTFVSTESVTVPGASLAIGSSTQVVPGTAEVGVEATNIGSDHNLSARVYNPSVNGISASGGRMSGGSKETIKIVTASDMHHARERLVEQNADAVKSQLEEEFGENVKILDDSFVVQPEEPESTVDVGDEAPNGKAKLTSRVHYRLSGVELNELERFLEAAIESRMNDIETRQVYDTGAEEAELSDFRTGDEVESIAIVAAGQAGPRIDEQSVKEESRSKRYGEIQSSLESIDGVSNVDVEFWPFWVRTVPGDIDRISIEFKIENND